MNKRLKKIDEFLDSLEKSALSATQTSYILSPNEGKVEAAGSNYGGCANDTAGSCSYNKGGCTNENVDACSKSTNIGTIVASCANTKMDYAPTCTTPTNPNTGGTCSSVSNMIGTSCAG